jgi:hypothetical protein
MVKRKPLDELTDEELVEKAHDEIRDRAAKIAKLAKLAKPKLSRAAIVHGLFGYRWPITTCGIDGLCDVLWESTMILEAMQDGASLEAAAGSVVMARGMRVHGGSLPRLTPPPAFPGDAK